ncbi:MAG: hypothetical protein WAL75_09345 [Terracidiphilus sp.]
MTVDSLAFFEYCLLAIAPTLLAWEWILRVARKQYPTALIVSTISCLWILAGLIWTSAIGPDYSNLHAYVAVVNLVANLLCALAAAALRTLRSYRIILANLSLAVVWIVTLLIMYAV